MRTPRPDRSRVPASLLAAIIAGAAAAGLTLTAPAALAQAQPGARTVNFVTTAASDVPLRSGNYTVFYPVARLKAGQVLAVVNEQDPEWLEVAYPPGTPAVVFTQEAELRERDGKKIVVTNRRSSLSAFNIAASGRSDHYKRVFRAQALPAGAELRFLEAMTDPQSGEVFAYKVEAPMGATGYVARTDVRTATAADAQRYLATVNMTAAQLAERLGLGADSATTVADGAPTPADTTGSTTTPTNTVAEGQQPPAGAAPVEGGPAVTMGELTGDGVLAARLDAPPEPSKWNNIDAVKKLDAAYDAISAEPLENAEFAPLIEEYRALLEQVPDEETTRSVREYINARIALLEIRRDLQATLGDLRALEASQETATGRLKSASRMALQGIEYTLTGRLERSTLYNGERLPLRYRLEVPQRGVRTLIAYVEPPESHNLDVMIGKTVTVFAKDRIDPESGFNVVHAREVSETPGN